MTAVSKVLVVGGGIGGLTAATALRQQGIDVDLVEINPDHKVYGVGIIQPNNTLRALDRIGLADACVAAGGAFPGWRIYDCHGALLLEAPNSSKASPGHPPVNGITRPKLQTILLDAARTADTNIRLGVTITTLDLDPEGVDVGFTDNSRGRYDFVVGSDGLNSQLRQRLFGDAVVPQFSGLGVWRHNFDRPVEVEWGGVYYGEQTKVGLVPMSPARMYMFVVSHEPDNPRFASDALATEMRQRLTGYTGLIARLAEQIIDPAGVVYRPMEHLLLPSPWYRGRVIVIGDAAHATTPHLAQGAAMAIEDAVLIAELLGRGTPVQPLLEEFMQRRFARARYVIDSSRQIADWEMEQWAGVVNPEANPGRLLGEATHKLMEAY